GTGGLGNAGYGVTLSTASNNTIGGTVAGSRNVIAFNGSTFRGSGGVGVLAGTGNSILGNSIFSNTGGDPAQGNSGLGINLFSNGETGGVTPNDPSDPDAGPNNLQNYPVLSTVTGNGTTTNITGSFNSVASKIYRLEFFTNDSVDPSGYGEGKTFLTAINVPTNAAGNATFNFNVPQLAPGLHVTSTATDPAGNTSEFSGANGQLLNISTRLGVLTGDKVGIGGFIIKGVAAKTVLVVGLGPSLAPFGISNFLADPILTLFRGSTTLATNDNWMDTQAVAINATGKAPQNNVEPAILQTLAPGSYTAVLGGKNNSTGVALVEVFDQSPASNSDLTNISTRGFVSTGSSVMIGGFISGNGIRKVIVRALGPTLADFHVTSVLADPVLSIHDANGNEIASNDNWQDTQAAEIQASGFAPPKPAESAIILTRPPGNTTAIVSGKNNTTGNALVEVYNLP
ncbi:MAG: hypothetical protein ABI839_04125, partial [Verrucomicrobiota bacterium]